MFVFGKSHLKSSFMVKITFFMSFLLLFWPKSSDAVVMATGVELNKLAPDFLFLHDH